MLAQSLLTATFILSSFHAIVRASPAALEGRSPPNPKQVIIQLFGWSWDSIAAECREFIGPAGYGYVLVNPPQEHIQGPQWWTEYQPVSYQLVSRHGNRQQFSNMIQECHSAGVKVIVDTVFNHMTGVNSGVGVAGSGFSHYEYPGIYSYTNFHHNCSTSDDNIQNYNDRNQVQNCQLVNLADLATETEYVRSRLAQYGNDLLSLGVDGFRLDAAKHMPTGDIANILQRLTQSPYITQEVVFGGEVQPNEYEITGDVQEFRYASALKSAFLGGSLSDIKDLDSRGWVQGGKANVFISNHDTERNGDSLNYNSPSNTYLLATIFSLAHPYGTPTILSSYAFSNNDDGPPNSGAGTCSGTGGENGWLCQHRWAAITGMVRFRETVSSDPSISNWVSPQADRIAFGRGALGFVAINNNDGGWDAMLHTDILDGAYCDVISGMLSNNKCTGATITVSNGQIRTIVPLRGAIAIHANSRLSGVSNHLDKLHNDALHSGMTRTVPQLSLTFDWANGLSLVFQYLDQMLAQILPVYLC